MNEKIAAWYTGAKDFAAGIDPTGTSTFRLASKYQGDHKKHRAAGDVGGFLGGTAIGALLPAAVIGGTALALRKKMPGLSKEFMTAMKGSADVINPVKMYKHIKSIPDIVRYKRQAFKVLNKSRRLGANAKGLQAGRGNIDANRLSRVQGKAKSFQKDQDLLQSMEKNISKKYYGGKTPSEGIGRTMTALTTVPAALATGALNMSSAHMQYNEALNQRRARGEKIAMLQKLAMFIS